MTVKGKKLNKDVIDHWPEILNEVRLNVLPVQYLESVAITFKNGKIWVINVSTTGKKTQRVESFEKELSDVLNTYNRHISDIDFRIDIRKIKRDIQKKTSAFLKNRLAS